MTTTFTQVYLNLQFDTSVLEEVVTVVKDMVGDNPNKVFTINTSVHVNSIEKANQVLERLEVLRLLEAIDHNKYMNACDQIERFKQIHMK